MYTIQTAELSHQNPFFLEIFYIEEDCTWNTAHVHAVVIVIRNPYIPGPAKLAPSLTQKSQIFPICSESTVEKLSKNLTLPKISWKEAPESRKTVFQYKQERFVENPEPQKNQWIYLYSKHAFDILKVYQNQKSMAEQKGFRKVVQCRKI